MTSQFLAAAASVALIGAGFSGAGTRSIEALPGFSTFGAGSDGGADDRCRVDVVRSGNPGKADITRQELDNGQCVCIVTTGPASSNGAAEDVVTALLRDRTCSNAPVVGRAVSDAAVGGTGGGSGTIIVTVLGVVGAAGLAVALGKDSNG